MKYSNTVARYALILNLVSAPYNTHRFPITLSANGANTPTRESEEHKKRKTQQDYEQTGGRGAKQQARRMCIMIWPCFVCKMVGPTLD
jgi:hypothetical protein